MIPIKPTFEWATFQIQHATQAISYLENQIYSFLSFKSICMV